MSDGTDLSLNLSDLWKVARQFGTIMLNTNDDGTYYARIKFQTIENTSLEAKSDFNQTSPEAALSMAIASAKATVDSLKKTFGEMKKEAAKIESTTTKGDDHAQTIAITPGNDK